VLLSHFFAFLLFFLKMENYFVLYWRKPNGISPRGALVVAFTPLHGISKWKMCLKQVSISYRSSRKIFIFFGIFVYFSKTKIYLFKVLKMFLETLSMFFEFIRYQNISRICSRIFGGICNILSTKYGFLGFFLNFINGKIRIWPELSSRPNPNYIYLCPASPRRARSRARNRFLRFNSQLPELLAEVRTGFLLGSGEGSFSGEPSPWFSIAVLRFSSIRRPAHPSRSPSTMRPAPWPPVGRPCSESRSLRGSKQGSPQARPSHPWACASLRGAVGPLAAAASGPPWPSPSPFHQGGSSVRERGEEEYD
jgi:hypothetical protein